MSSTRAFKLMYLASAYSFYKIASLITLSAFFFFSVALLKSDVASTMISCKLV